MLHPFCSDPECEECREKFGEQHGHVYSDNEVSVEIMEIHLPVEIIEKISNTTYVDFYMDFHTNKMYPNLRFGQAFLDAIYPEIVDPDLYYEEDTNDAVVIIFERYVDMSLSFDSGRKYYGRNLFVKEEE